MTTKQEPTPVPKSVREQLQHKWRSCDAEALREHHAKHDERDGPALNLIYDEPLPEFWWVPRETLRALVKDGAIPEEWVQFGEQSDAVHHLASASLQQFWHEAGVAYARHLKRMAAWS